MRTLEKGKAAEESEARKIKELTGELNADVGFLSGYADYSAQKYSIRV